MGRSTLKIPICNRKANEINQIIKAVLKKHRYAVKMISGELVWSYGDSRYEVIPCISGVVEKETLILQGWFYDAEDGTEYGLKPYCRTGLPRRRVKAIMKEIAYLIQYKK